MKKYLNAIAGIAILFNILPFCFGALAHSIGMHFWSGYIEGCEIMVVLIIISSVALFGIELVKSAIKDEKKA